MSQSEDVLLIVASSKFIIVVLAVFLSGCTLLLGDTVKRDMSKLTPNICPDLSGKYELGGYKLRTRGLHQNDKQVEDVLMIDYLPTEQKNEVDNIYESLFDLNKPFRINYRKTTSPTTPKRFDYLLDWNKVKRAYVELSSTAGSEYIVNVYSSNKQFLGKFKTKLLSANSLCSDNKYYTFLQQPSSTMAGEDWTFTVKRSSGEMTFYRSESGAFIRENVGRTKSIVFGIIPITQGKSQIIVTFPRAP